MLYNSNDNPNDLEKNGPLVSVGIPTYNRPEGLRRTLECITKQTYTNLEIIVSDNCSPSPEVEAIVCEYMRNDNRIRYFRHERNKGAGFNFQFVLEKATGEYFMWAADDDQWEKNFIENCLNEIMINGNNNFAFTNIDMIDTFSQVIRIIPSFKKFDNPIRLIRIVNFLLDHEYSGKANLFYCLGKRNFFLTAFQWMKNITDIENIPIDVCFVFFIICRYNIKIHPKICFHKGYATEFDQIGKPTILSNKYPVVSNQPFNFYKKYTIILMKATDEYSIKFIIVVCMSLRCVFECGLNQINNLKNRFVKRIFSFEIS